MASALAELESKWGKCTKDIAVNYGRVFYLSDRIYVFEESEKIALDGTVYDFKDIIGFSLLNKSKTIYNTYSTGKSKKDLGNMVARGIAGKMIGGDVGAVIGALSTPDEYEEDTEYDNAEDKSPISMKNKRLLPIFGNPDLNIGNQVFRTVCSDNLTDCRSNRR